MVQQQRADMDSARDSLSALCRSHPSQELSFLSSDLTSIAKRTEAVAQRCAKTRGSLQDGLQLHFNGKRMGTLMSLNTKKRRQNIIDCYFLLFSVLQDISVLPQHHTMSTVRIGSNLLISVKVINDYKK